VCRASGFLEEFVGRVVLKLEVNFREEKLQKTF
jgi:hypothetical protein